MVETGIPQAKKLPDYHRYPAWTPRFWHGMPSHVWWSLLSRNGFRITPRRIPMAAALMVYSPVTDLLALGQHLIHGRAIRRTPLAGPPIFILGHWRSGTTLLHELFELDSRFASPTTYSCFAPWHFLLTEGLVQRFGGFLLPEKRPMDNMRAGWALPQEDEFALMNLGAPSPYLRIAFPRNEPPYTSAIDMQDLSTLELQRWKSNMDWFMRALTYKTGKPLILKSPPHTGRIGVLHQMYPDAKFVHIVRDPRKLFPSTLRLWKSLDAIQGLQLEADQQKLEEYVLSSLNRMYDAFEKQRQAIPASQIIDVTYEELVAKPIEVLQRIYREIDLGDFESIRVLHNDRQNKDRDYQTNQHDLDPAAEARVMQVWGDYARRYGYA